MLRHVLVPLDGSPLAEKALDYARRVLAPDGKATLLTILHKPQPPVYAYPSAEAFEQIAEDKAEAEHAPQQAREYMERMAKNFQLGGIADVQIEIASGDPAEVIVERARVLGVEAIVMSTHGRSGISRLLFGSITLKVLSDTPCPVLVVPSKEQERVKKSQTADNPADLNPGKLAAE